MRYVDRFSCLYLCFIARSIHSASRASEYTLTVEGWDFVILNTNASRLQIILIIIIAHYIQANLHYTEKLKGRVTSASDTNVSHVSTIDIIDCASIVLSVHEPVPHLLFQRIPLHSKREHIVPLEPFISCYGLDHSSIQRPVNDVLGIHRAAFQKLDLHSS